jgi:hypothetical protein
MVGFNQAWAADFYNVESLPTDFRDKPTGLDRHHVGTKSNVTSHPDINVRRLLRELGTRLETFTDESGQVSKRSFFDTGNSKRRRVTVLASLRT